MPTRGRRDQDQLVYRLADETAESLRNILKERGTSILFSKYMFSLQLGMCLFL